MVTSSRSLRKSTTSQDRSLEIPLSIEANPERVCDAIDVVEPGSDQRDLQDGPVVEPGAAQPLVVVRGDLGCVLGELDHVVDHDALFFRDGSFRVVFLQCLDQCFVQRNPTQKLCV
jgi:hypothetical protein